MHLEIDVVRRDGATVLRPHGDLDFATADRLREAVTAALVDGDPHVVVDLVGVDFVDSTGLGALIGGRRRALALNGRFTLVCAEGHLLQVFAVTGLDKVFAIAPTVHEATAQQPAR